MENDKRTGSHESDCLVLENVSSEEDALTNSSATKSDSVIEEEQQPLSSEDENGIDSRVLEKYVMQKFSSEEAESNIMNVLVNPRLRLSLRCEFPLEYEWILGKFITEHICGCKEMYTNYYALSKDDPQIISLKNFPSLTPKGKGDVTLRYDYKGGWKTLILSNVYYVPGILHVVSLVALRKAKVHEFRQRKKKESNGDTVYRLILLGNKVPLKFEKNLVLLPFEPVLNTRNNESTFQLAEKSLSFEEQMFLWHGRFLHLAEQSMRCVIRIENLIRNSKFLVDQRSFLCKFCEDQILFSGGVFKPGYNITWENGEYLELTMCAAAQTSLFNNVFLVTIQDMRSGFATGFSCKDIKSFRNGIVSCVLAFKAFTKRNVQCLVVKNLPENDRRNDMIKMLGKLAIKQLNCKLEVCALANVNDFILAMHVLDIIRHILGLVNFDYMYWCRLVFTATNMYNMTNGNTIELSTKTVFEHMTERPPPWTIFRTIGCKSFINYRGNTMMCRFMGYDDNAGRYIFYDTRNHGVVESKDAIFFEESLMYPYFAKDKTSLFMLRSVSPSLVSNDDEEELDATILPAKIENCFMALENVEGFDVAGITRALQPLDKHLKCFERKCITSIVKQSSDVSKRRLLSTLFDDFLLPIKCEFDLYSTSPSPSSFYTCISISLFGHSQYKDLLRLLLLKHICQHWKSLSRCREIFYESETLAATVRHLKNKDFPCLTSHIFLFSQVLKRPIFEYDMNWKNAVIELSYYNSDPANEHKQPIYLLYFSDRFRPLIPKTQQQGTVGANTIQKEMAIRMFPKVEHKYLVNRYNPRHCPNQLWKFIVSPFKADPDCKNCVKFKDKTGVQKRLKGFKESFEDNLMESERLHKIFNKHAQQIALVLGSIETNAPFVMDDHKMVAKVNTVKAEIKQYCNILDWLKSELRQLISYFDNILNSKPFTLINCICGADITVSGVKATLRDLNKEDCPLGRIITELKQELPAGQTALANSGPTRSNHSDSSVENPASPAVTPSTSTGRSNREERKRTATDSKKSGLKTPHKQRKTTGKHDASARFKDDDDDDDNASIPTGTSSSDNSHDESSDVVEFDSDKLEESSDDSEIESDILAEKCSNDSESEYDISTNKSSGDSKIESVKSANASSGILDVDTDVLEESTDNSEVNENLKCDVCGKDDIANKAAFSRHKRMHKDPEEFPKCPECPYTNHRKDVVDKHYNNVHKHKKEYWCPICNIMYHKSNFYEEHMYTKHGVK